MSLRDGINQSSEDGSICSSICNNIKFVDYFIYHIISSYFNLFCLFTISFASYYRETRCKNNNGEIATKIIYCIVYL